mmetsp:Transcript_28808/g.68030  ORF Transcript_28808/g.68030 Transcript_28808/m.68030 type:complete len:104 (+) Transcript_28808:114-425(+)
MSHLGWVFLGDEDSLKELSNLRHIARLHAPPHSFVGSDTNTPFPTETGKWYAGGEQPSTGKKCRERPPVSIVTPGSLQCDGMGAREPISGAEHRDSSLGQLDC